MIDEPERYKPIKYLLLAASVGTCSAALLQHAWAPWGMASVVLICSIGWWLWRARSVLSSAYLKREAEAAIPSKRDKWVWGEKKPRIRDLAWGFFFCSFLALWFGYRASVEPYKARTGSPVRLLDLIYAYAGTAGVVVFWTAVGLYMMTLSAELIVGSQTKRDP